MEASTVQIVIGLGQLLITGVAVLFGWLLKGLFANIGELKQADKEVAEKVQALAVRLPEHYVSKADFKEMGDNIFGTLRRIEEKLDRKADR